MGSFVAVSISNFTASKNSAISEELVGKDVEGSGRGQISGTTPAFAWKD
jgi:hypothetical protein